MYVTRMGECWDEVSKAVYGSEKYVGTLMQSNMPLLDIAVFSAGTCIQTPDLPREEINLPPWRKGS